MERTRPLQELRRGDVVVPGLLLLTLVPAAAGSLPVIGTCAPIGAWMIRTFALAMGAGTQMIALVSLAFAATPIDAGELENSGHVLPADTTRINLMGRVAHSFGPRLELRTRSLGWYSEANLAVKVGLLVRDRAGLAVLGVGNVYWSGGASVGVLPTMTLGPALGTHVDLGLGYVLTRRDRATNHSVPLRTAVTGSFGERDCATVGAVWLHRFGILRLGGGAMVSNVGFRDLGDITERVDLGPNVSLPEPLISPYLMGYLKL